MKVKWQSNTPSLELKVPSEVKIDGGGYPPYELPIASEEVLGGVKIDGDTITITDDGVISAKEVDLSGVATKDELSGVEAKIPNTTGLATKTELAAVEDSIPNEYVKDASVTDNKLTITKSSGDTVEFSGGGEKQIQYNLSSSGAFTQQDKEIIKSAIKFGTGFFIDHFKVVRIMNIGLRYVFIILKPNGTTDNHIVGYQVSVDDNYNVTSNVFTTFIDYVLVGSNSAVSGDIITSNNWDSYITLNADDWIAASASDSNLYNAKQLWVIGISGQQYYEGIFRFDYSAATTVLGDCTSIQFSLGENFQFSYNGVSLSTMYTGTLLAIYYKT